MLLCAQYLLYVPQAQAKLAVRSAILLNMNTGRILYEQNADASIPPASLTKIMTMYIAMDAVKAKRISLHKKTRVSRSAAATGGSRMHLKAGERVSLDELLTGMAVASGNDAAMAVAQRVAMSSRNFVTRMNAKAKSLGMRRSVFKTPHGLPAKGQKTTARDMLRLARSYMTVHPIAMRFHRTKAFRHGKCILYNTNRLLGTVPGVDGLKTGWIVASGYHLIVTGKRGKVRLLAVVMGGSNKNIRDREARRLIEAGFATPYNSKKVKQRLSGRR
ncbi:MAG: D-alanyl-D-alanine carboxypeptidase [Desulfovibrionaceae bacterium]|nr:D-alanyl-D-alanine carboxypeptidase [Desulfovibrionaceae bacterium]